MLEVAYSQKERDAQRKVEDYILGIENVKFVVLVIVTKKPGKKTTHAKQSTTSLPDEDELSPHHDSVYVHVYKSVVRGNNTLTGEHIVNKVQTFPGPNPADTFTISWDDINCGTWLAFCNGAHLPPDTLMPTCNINFSNVASIARKNLLAKYMILHPTDL